jgi:EpsI family protein
MLTRAVVAAALIVMTGVYTRGVAGPEHVAARSPLAEIPIRLGAWQGFSAAPFADDVVAQLGVDDYVNRRYAAGNGLPISLYVGYYASQRQGDTIHSPQNCLPGAGWRPLVSGRTEIDAGGRMIPVNRFVIQKGIDKQAVFYWYQGRGRVVANEFANKGWLMLDAARLRRTDGGLVRLMTPIGGTTESAFDSLEAFSATLAPHLSRHLP